MGARRRKSVREISTGYAENPATSGRPDPAYSNIKNFTTPNAGGSIYNGLQVAIQHRFSQAFSTQIAYTLSRLKDSTTGPFYYPNNPFNLAAEWGPSPDNQTNTLTVAGTYSIWKGIALSGQLHFGSGQNFQVLSSVTPLGLSGVVDNRLVRQHDGYLYLRRRVSAPRLVSPAKTSWLAIVLSATRLFASTCGFRRPLRLRSITASFR